MLSKRYGIKPSDFLQDDISDHQFNILVFSVGAEAEFKAQEKANKTRSRRGR